MSAREARWYAESHTWQGDDYLWLNRFRDTYALLEQLATHIARVSPSGVAITYPHADFDNCAVCQAATKIALVGRKETRGERA